MSRLIPAALLAALALGCGGGSDPTAATTAMSQNQVVIQGFAFNPPTQTVALGTTVTWVNKDAVAHTTTGGSDPETWDSRSLATNASFSHTFTVTGTYQYACAIHPSMHGTIVVTK